MSGKDSSGGPASDGIITTLVLVKYGSNKSFPVNPNSGLSGVMEFIRRAMMNCEKDHLELCDESGKLINPEDFPSMMLLSAFVKPHAEEAVFIPIKVERDSNKQITRLEPLLTDPEKTEVDILLRMKKENHIPREKRNPRGESAHARQQNQQEGASSVGTVGHSAKVDSRKNHHSAKAAK